MQTCLDLVSFHRKFGHPTPESPVVHFRTDPLTADRLKFREALIREESAELLEALESGRLSKVAREAVDLAYVALGTLTMLGVNPEPCWRIVQRHNMLKVPDPLGGKPTKPSGWTGPDGDLYQELLRQQKGGSMPKKGFLSGRKTYVTAGLTIVASWAAFAVGGEVLGQEALSLGETVQLTVAALLAVFLRSGVAKAEKK